jgi:hypothetical protein
MCKVTRTDPEGFNSRLIRGHRHRSIGQVRPRRLFLAAEFGLVPLSLGGVLGHDRLVEPFLDIAAEAVRSPIELWAGEVEFE